MKYWAIWYRPVTRSYSFPHSETCGGMELQMAASLHPPSNDDLPNTSTQTVIWASERKGPRMCFSAVSDEPGRQIGKWKITPYGHRVRSGSSVSSLWCREKEPSGVASDSEAMGLISRRWTRCLNRSASHTDAGGELTRETNLRRSEMMEGTDDSGDTLSNKRRTRHQRVTQSRQKGSMMRSEKAIKNAWHVPS